MNVKNSEEDPGRTLALIGVPLEAGAGRGGCSMGPSALRIAGLEASLRELGMEVHDYGNIDPDAWESPPFECAPINHSAEVLAWARPVREAVADAASSGSIPIILGGDHSLSAWSVSAMMDVAEASGRPLFLLWLDAHPDLHSLDTTESGNLHGCPLAYLTGHSGFEGYPQLVNTLPAERVALIGLRSVDREEKTRLANQPFMVTDMRALDEGGVIQPMRVFLEKVRAQNGLLHLSLDVDFLDPSIAPGVGTTVPGGASFREGHLIMELLHDSGLVSSLDLVELNPFLDDRGKTAHLLCDLAASLFGRSVLSRPTRSLA